MISMMDMNMIFNFILMMLKNKIFNMHLSKIFKSINIFFYYLGYPNFIK
jgi:hypothetical protein